MELSERKIRILQAIIDDYISTAEPVGSRTIAKRYDLGISSATIRNEMADLEDMGYLVQLHSSSGRIPSDKGYRLYVDKLMQVPQISSEEELIIKSKLINSALFQVDKILKQATELLSELTNLTCIVETPSVKKSYLKSIQLLEIDNFNVVLVIVTDSGIVKNSMIRMKTPVRKDIILQLNNILNERLRGLTIEQINLEVINGLKKDLRGYEDIFDAIIPNLYECLNEAGGSEVYLEGVTNMLKYPEYEDINKARDFLSFMDDENNIKSLLTENQKLSVIIGSENFIEQAKDCSIITAIYGVNGRPLGTIGLIGPTRIPYSKVLSILNKLVKELNYSIKQNYLNDKR